MKKNQRSITSHQVVSREEWTTARIALLAQEKELTRARDAIAATRRALPWVKVDKEYVFDAPEHKLTLSELFAGRSQLFVKHFMLAPGQPGQCVGCSFEADHIGGVLVHLEHHDISYVAIARAPIEEIEAVRKRMNWSFPWVSSFHSDFNYDFNVSFTPEEMARGHAYYNYEFMKPPIEDLSGNSVFIKDASGQIFHTYSVFGRGGEEMLGAYNLIDMTPKGRDERGPHKTLADWVRPHDMYDRRGIVEATGRYHPSECTCSAHAKHA